MDSEWKGVDSEKFREAVRAVQARSPGHDPVVVRAALEEELANRGQTEVSPASVERATRMLVAAQGRLAPVRLTREVWKLGAEVATALRSLRDGKEMPDWLKPPPGHELGIRTKVNPDGPGEIFETVEVDLADGIQSFLAKAFDASFDPESDDEGESQCKVWANARRPLPSGAPLPVILGQEPIGALDAEDAQTLARDLREAERQKQPLILEATIEREQGGFSVWVLVP